MSRKLPPLNALRAFEAAARHLSFTKAAQELNVTQAAISHQVKALEETLGIALFKRLNRALLLTEAGQAYLPPLREAFDLMDAATRGLKDRGMEGPLKVTSLSSFAGKWLLPRLHRFRERYPEIDVLVSAKDSLVDFATDDVDMGIRYGGGVYDGLVADFLLPDSYAPMCSPKLLDGAAPLRAPADLRHHTLLHDDVDPGFGWQGWLRQAGVEGIDPNRGPGYSDSSMVIAAAIAGQGVALGRISLAVDDIRSGRLVIPFGPVLESHYANYLVVPKARESWPKVQAFRSWMLEEAATSGFDDVRPSR